MPCAPGLADAVIPSAAALTSTSPTELEDRQPPAVPRVNSSLSFAIPSRLDMTRANGVAHVRLTAARATLVRVRRILRASRCVKRVEGR